MNCRRLHVLQFWIMSVLLALSMAAPPAGAAPVLLATGTLDALRGGTIDVDLQVDAVTGFEAADLQIVFDPGVLSFENALLGTIDPSGSVVPGPTYAVGGLSGVDVSILVGGHAVTTSNAATLMRAIFRVRTDAPYGQSTVTFSSLDNDLLDVQPLPVTLTVLQPTTPHGVPAPGGPTLVLLMLAAASLARRGRRQRR